MKPDRTIRMTYGTDGRAMAIALLEAHDAIRLVPAGAPVALKPNLVVARPASGGATTHPEIVRGAIEYLRDHGVRDITVMEGSWVGDSTRRAFDRCGYADLARRYGVGLVDLKEDETRAVDTPIGPVQVCVRVLETGFLLNLPVLKGHCQTLMTCALKNLKGCISDSEKRRFHTMGLHRPIAALAAAIRPALTLVDSLCGDHGFEEGGDPVVTNRLYIGEDPVHLDVLGCRLLGLDPDLVAYITLAEKYGAGSMSLTGEDVLEIGSSAGSSDEADGRSSHADAPWEIREDMACSACSAALARALDTLRREGADLSRLPPLSIGQGYRDRPVVGIGLGKCANDVATAGKAGQSSCPPTSEEILEILREALT